MEDHNKNSTTPSSNNSLSNDANEIKNNDFVTILQVDNKVSEKQDFVTRLTVLSEQNNFKNNDEKCGITIKDSCVNEEVIIYRLPGERLGMGLKFIGGENVSECISSLYIQSITPDSPASRTHCQWGCLEEGDEILQIEKRDVSLLTRLDCVSILKNAPVALSILVQHKLNDEIKNQCSDYNEKVNEINNTIDEKSQQGKNSDKVKQDQNFKSSENLENFIKELTENETQIHQIPVSLLLPKITKTEEFNTSTEKVKLISTDGKNLPIMNKLENYAKDTHNLHPMNELPVVADIYTDLIAEEDKKLYEYESDDTGSSASTVIDIISVPNTSLNYGLNKCSSYNENGCLDFAQALLPFEELENELNADFSKTIIKNAFEQISNLDENSNQDTLKKTNKQSLISSNKIPSYILKREPEHKPNNEFLLSTIEGHVSQERRKFEILIEQAMPKQIKNSQNYNKQYSSLQLKKKVQQLDTTSSTNYIMKKENVPPPIPPRQHKRNKNTSNVKEDESNIPIISLSSQAQQQVKGIKGEPKDIQTACNNSSIHDEDCPTSNLTNTENSERLLAVQFWLEDSIKSFSFSEENEMMTSKLVCVNTNSKQLIQDSNNDQLLGGETGSASASTPILDSGASSSLDVSNTFRNEMENGSISSSVITMKEKIHEENENKSDLPNKSELDFSPAISRMPPDGHEFPPSFDESLKAKQYKLENEEKKMLSNSVSNNVKDETAYIMKEENKCMNSGDKQILSGPLFFNIMPEIKNNQTEETVSDNKDYVRKLNATLSTQSLLKQQENNAEKLDKENSKDSLKIKESEIPPGISSEYAESEVLNSSINSKSEQECHSEQKIKHILNTNQHEDASCINNSTVNSELNSTITEQFIFDFMLKDDYLGASKDFQKQSKEFPESQENKKNQGVEYFLQQTTSKQKQPSMDQNNAINNDENYLKISTQRVECISSELNQPYNKGSLQHEDSSQSKTETSSKNDNENNEDNKDTLKQISNNNHNCTDTDFKHFSKDINKSIPQKKRENSFSTLSDKIQLQDSTISLYSLLETRRQQVSKLKGLIIPERSETQSTAEKILPIPLIKSSKTTLSREKPSFTKDKYTSLPRGIQLACHCSQNDIESISDKINKDKSNDNNKESYSNKCTDGRNVKVDNTLNQQPTNRSVNKHEDSNLKLDEKRNSISSQPVKMFQFKENTAQLKEAKLYEVDGRKFRNSRQETLSITENESRCRENSALTNYTPSSSNHFKEVISKNNMPTPYSGLQLHNDITVNSNQIQRKSNYHGNINQLHNCLTNQTQNNKINEFVKNKPTENHNILQYQKNNDKSINSVSMNSCLYSSLMESNVASAKELTLNKDINNFSKNSLNNETAIHRQKWEDLQEKYKHHSRNICSVDMLPEQSPSLRKQCPELSKDITLNTEFKPKHLSRQITVLNTNHVSGDSVKTFKALAEQWEQRSQDTKPTEKYTLSQKYFNQASSPSTVVHKTKDKTFISKDNKLNQYQRVDGLTSYNANETPIWNKNKRHSIDVVEKIPFQLENNELKEENGFDILNMSQRTTASSKNMSLKDTFIEIKSMDNLNHMHKIKESLPSKLRNNEIKPITTEATSKHKYFSFDSFENEKCFNNSNNQQGSDHSEVNQCRNKENQSPHDDVIVILHRDVPNRTTGISINGGRDCESKEITVNKIISNSLADRDGRIKEGDSIISINGQNTTNLTYSEALDILNAPHIECTLVLKRKTTSLRHHLAGPADEKMVIKDNQNRDAAAKIIPTTECE